MPPVLLPLRLARAPGARVSACALAVLVVVGAACQPVKNSSPPGGPPSTYCHPTTPTTAAEYHNAWTAFRQANTGLFVAADGSLPFRLDDGRIIWFFGDTIIGRTQDGHTVDPFLFTARTSIVVQEGACFTPRFEVFPNQPNGEWLWPTDAFIQGGWLRVVVAHMTPDPSQPPGFQFDFLRNEVATFSLTDLQFQTLSPFPIATAPPNPNYGETITIDSVNGYLYAYGRERIPCAPPCIPTDRHYVARVPLAQVWSSAMWEFLDDPSELLLDDEVWVQNDPDAADPMTFDGDAPLPDYDDGPLAGFPVEPLNGGFLGSALDFDVIGRNLQTWESTSASGEPRGPWTLVGTNAAEVSYSLLHQSSFPYGGRILFLPAVTPMAMWSVNADFDAVLADANLYRAYFTEPAMGSIPP